MSTLEERIKRRQTNYENKISNIGKILANLTSILIKLGENGIVGLEEKDIQYLRRHNIEIDTNSTIY